MHGAFLTCGLQTCLLDVKYLFVYFPGFTGTNCEVNIDDCRNHQCQNGATCIDGIEEYTCRCTQHWKGRQPLSAKLKKEEEEN